MHSNRRQRCRNYYPHFRYHGEGERVKTWLYGLLSALLLLTAAIVSNIESVQQTLNVTLETAYLHVFIPVEALIWIHSIAIVLLIVAHAMRHVQVEKPGTASPAVQAVPTSQFEISPELVQMLRSLIAEVRVTEEQDAPLQLPVTTSVTAPEEAQAEDLPLVALANVLPDVTQEEITAVLRVNNSS